MQFGHTGPEGNLLSNFTWCCLVLHEQIVIVHFKTYIELRMEAKESINFKKGHIVLMLNKSSMPSRYLKPTTIILFLLTLLHTHIPPSLLLCPLSPTPSLVCKTLLQSPPPYQFTHWRPWRLIYYPAPPNCPPPLTSTPPGDYPNYPCTWCCP